MSSAGADRTLVIRDGTLIDGSGRPPVPNDALVIEGHRIKNVGRLPESLRSSGGRDDVQVIDASGQWIMPGLIDAHTHLSYGFPHLRGEGRGRGTMRPELGVLKAAWSAQKVLRSGVTSISVPGGTWFTDVGVRDAIKLGVLEGPRVHCAGRMIITYGSIEDDEPSWVGTPDHSVGVLCNSAAEMVTEVRRQCKHGVNFVKMADSRSGDLQEGRDRRGRRRGAPSRRASRDPLARRRLHTGCRRGRGGLDHPLRPGERGRSGRCRAGGGGDPADHDVPGNGGGSERPLRPGDDPDGRGRILCGTDTGNNSFMPFGELHAKELEIFVTYCGFTPMEALVAATRGNAFAVGLEGDLGVLEAGKLADIVVLRRDPLADIRSLAGGRELACIIKDGAVVSLGDGGGEPQPLALG